MRIPSKTIYWLSVGVLGAALGLSLQFVLAWTEPTQAPPNGNVSAPLNTAAVDQTKGNSTSGKINAKDFCLNSDPSKCLSKTMTANCVCFTQYHSGYVGSLWGMQVDMTVNCGKGWTTYNGLNLAPFNTYSDVWSDSRGYPCYN
jgi:hypothetical protein